MYHARSVAVAYKHPFLRSSGNSDSEREASRTKVGGIAMTELVAGTLSTWPECPTVLHTFRQALCSGLPRHDRILESNVIPACFSGCADTNMVAGKYRTIGFCSETSGSPSSLLFSSLHLFLSPFLAIRLSLSSSSSLLPSSSLPFGSFSRITFLVSFLDSFAATSGVCLVQIQAQPVTPLLLRRREGRASSLCDARHAHRARQGAQRTEELRRTHTPTPMSATPTTSCTMSKEMHRCSQAHEMPQGPQ